MGIRYYAYPLAPEFVDRALDDPRPFLSDDPLADAWELYGTPRPEMLYLDKCWSLLQRLTWPDPGAPRLAYALFQGNVTQAPLGWIPWIWVLAPAEVFEVARDLALLDEDSVDALLSRDDFGTDDHSADREYITHHLREAQAFTARMKQRGWGLVYTIG